MKDLSELQWEWLISLAFLSVMCLVALWGNWIPTGDRK